MVLDTSNAGIPGTPVVWCESAMGDPAPPKSIAGGHGDGRLQPLHRRSKTAEKSLLRRFGHLVLGDLRISRCCGAKRRGGTRLPG